MLNLLHADGKPLASLTVYIAKLVTFPGLPFAWHSLLQFHPYIIQILSEGSGKMFVKDTMKRRYTKYFDLFKRYDYFARITTKAYAQRTQKQGDC